MLRHKINLILTSMLSVMLCVVGCNQKSIWAQSGIRNDDSEKQAVKLWKDMGASDSMLNLCDQVTDTRKISSKDFARVTYGLQKKTLPVADASLGLLTLSIVQNFTPIQKSKAVRLAKNILETSYPHQKSMLISSAIHVLWFHGDKSVLPLLKNLAESRDDKVRVSAKIALSKVKERF